MRWIMIIIAVAFLASTFLMYDSGSRRRSPDGSRGNYAVAEINGKKMMLSTLYERLQTRMEGSGGREVTSMDFQLVLEDYAIEQQLAQEVRDSRITVTDAEVDQAMKEYVDQVFPTRESFYQFLDRTGRKLADYKKDLAQQMVRQKFVDQTIGIVMVDEDEAVKFYDDMKSIFFRQPAGYMTNIARYSSENEARKVRALLSGGRPWEEATSDDVVASSDVVYVTKEPTFLSDAMFDGFLLPMRYTELGAVSPIFEVASNDYAVGIKSERIGETVTAYDEVSADIRSVLQQQKEREAVGNFRLGLLSRANVVILDPDLFQSREADFQPVTEEPDNPPKE